MINIFEKLNPFKRRNTVTYLSILPSGADPTGYQYDPATALNIPAVMAGVRVLSETVAVLPVFMYRRTTDGKERTDEHPLFNVLHDRPNAWQTAFEWRLTAMQDLVLWGNHISEKVFNANGSVIGLVPLHPNFEVRRSGNHLVYDVTDYDGKQHQLNSKFIFHVRALGDHDYKGISPLHFAKTTLALARDAETYSQSVFTDGGGKRLGLKLQGQLSAENESRMREDWTRIHGKNSKLAFFPKGIDPIEVGIDPGDSEYIACRKFQINEIARILRIPPHLIGDLDRATFSNITQQDLEYLKYTLWPWLERFEQAISRDLIGNSKTYYAEFDLRGLLRSDPETRAAYWNTMKVAGVMTTNEIRNVENMNPIDDGDILWQPANMMPAGTELGDNSKDDSNDDSKDDEGNDNEDEAMVQDTE